MYGTPPFINCHGPSFESLAFYLIVTIIIVTSFESLTFYLITFSEKDSSPDVGGQGQRKSGQLCLVLVRPDRQTADRVFLRNPDKIRTADRIETDRVRTDRHRKAFFSKNPDRILTPDRIETDRIRTDRHRTENPDRIRIPDRHRTDLSCVVLSRDSEYMPQIT